MKPAIKAQLIKTCRKHIGYGCNRCPLFEVCAPLMPDTMVYLAEELEEE